MFNKEKIEIEEVIDPADISTIRQAIKKSGTNMLSIIRQSLRDEYSFGQIRLVLAEMQKEKQVSV